jgi:succinyl-CoA synthetase beta subunit
MNIHEYQGKFILRQYQIPVQDGVILKRDSDEKELQILKNEELKKSVFAVKAQIHAGGRGKGAFLEQEAGDKGGVRIVRSLSEAYQEAKNMLGHTLVTKQTGKEGKEVNQVYIEVGCDIAKEFYLALLIDRTTSSVAFVCSKKGGMDIEKVAEDNPSDIVTIDVDPNEGFSDYHGRKVALALGLNGNAFKSCVKMTGNLYKMFIEKNCDMIEINPLILGGEESLVCLDCKMSFDGNALYKNRDIESLRDETEEDQKELRASKFDLNYISLDGEIGCMVNGAGLAMATMDIIKLNGSEPANFLDVGGGATKEKVYEAFKIITSDKKVKGILVNIFGGIMRCDVIAEGVVSAAREVGLEVPLVVRLEGTNVEKGKQIINSSGLNVISANNLNDAAAKIVAEVKK